MPTKNKEDYLTVRVTPDFKQRIQDLIDDGKYENIADFVRDAIADKLDPST